MKSKYITWLGGQDVKLTVGELIMNGQWLPSVASVKAWLNVNKLELANFKGNRKGVIQAFRE